MSTQNNQEMAGVHSALGVLAGKMDRVIALIERTETDFKTDLKEQGRRLSKVENRQHWYSGVAAVIGALISAVISHKIT